MKIGPNRVGPGGVLTGSYSEGSSTTENNFGAEQKRGRHGVSPLRFVRAGGHSITPQLRASPRTDRCTSGRRPGSGAPGLMNRRTRLDQAAGQESTWVIVDVMKPWCVASPL